MLPLSSGTGKVPVALYIRDLEGPYETITVTATGTKRKQHCRLFCTFLRRPWNNYNY